MASFKIIGGKKLHGQITPQGAKNEALQILSAVLLTSEKVFVSNIPDIIDVNKLIEILVDLGVKVEKLGKGSYSFQACLLYTSPSPRDMRRSRMPSSA